MNVLYIFILMTTLQRILLNLSQPFINHVILSTSKIPAYFFIPKFYRFLDVAVVTNYTRVHIKEYISLI